MARPLARVTGEEAGHPPGRGLIELRRRLVEQHDDSVAGEGAHDRERAAAHRRRGCRPGGPRARSGRPRRAAAEISASSACVDHAAANRAGQLDVLPHAEGLGEARRGGAPTATPCGVPARSCRSRRRRTRRSGRAAWSSRIRSARTRSAFPRRSHPGWSGARTTVSPMLRPARSSVISASPGGLTAASTATAVAPPSAAIVVRCGEHHGRSPAVPTSARVVMPARMRSASGIRTQPRLSTTRRDSAEPATVSAPRPAVADVEDTLTDATSRGVVRHHEQGRPELLG